MCQIWNNYLLPKLSLATNNNGHTSTHSVSSCKHPSIIIDIIYYFLWDLLPTVSINIKFYISCWQTHFNLKLSNGTLLWKKSNMILPLKKNCRRILLQHIKIKKIYSVATVNCSHLDKKWFFILFHASPVAVNFVNFSVCWRGCKWLLIF